MLLEDIQIGFLVTHVIFRLLSSPSTPGTFVVVVVLQAPKLGREGSYLGALTCALLQVYLWSYGHPHDHQQTFILVG